MVNIFDENAFPKAPTLTKEEIKVKIKDLVKGIRQDYEKILTE